eukprot:7320858-Pyramimonas_sp.AAC.1
MNSHPFCAKSSSEDEGHWHVRFLTWAIAASSLVPYPHLCNVRIKQIALAAEHHGPAPSLGQGQ